MTDGRTHGRTDRPTEAIAISPTLFLKKRGENNGKLLSPCYFKKVSGDIVIVSVSTLCYLLLNQYGGK